MKSNCSEDLANFASAIQKERRGWGGVGGCGLIKAIPPREGSVSSAVNSGSPQPLYLVIQKLYKRVLGLHAGFTQSDQTRIAWFKGIRVQLHCRPWTQKQRQPQEPEHTRNKCHRATGSPCCWGALGRLADPSHPALTGQFPACTLTGKPASLRPRSGREVPENPCLGLEIG